MENRQDPDFLWDEELDEDLNRTLSNCDITVIHVEKPVKETAKKGLIGKTKNVENGDNDILSETSRFQETGANFPDESMLAVGKKGPGAVPKKPPRSNVTSNLVKKKFGKTADFSGVAEPEKITRGKVTPAATSTPRSKPVPNIPRIKQVTCRTASRVATSQKSGINPKASKVVHRDSAENQDPVQRPRSSSTSRTRLPSSTRVTAQPTSLPDERKKNIEVKRGPFHEDRMSLDEKALNAFGTLPRRNKSRVIPGEISAGLKSRSQSESRIQGTGARTFGARESICRSALPSQKTKPVKKTRIYYETGVQTVLTGEDMDDAGEENERLKAELNEMKQHLHKEKENHAFARNELERNVQRLLMMLGSQKSEHSAEGSDGFLELETHLLPLEKNDENQRNEVPDLQSRCRVLQRNLEKSLASQGTLIVQLQKLETESYEMQDFLMEEKASLANALREAELDIQKSDESLKRRESELEQKTKECTRLTRINEQRQREQSSLAMKLSAIEKRSQELLLAQGATISGAAVALSSLGNRLETLVDQLVTSCTISEKHLEDAIYDDEVYDRIYTALNPNCKSVISAVIEAIQNAPKSAEKSPERKFQRRRRTDFSLSSSDLLDSETELSSLGIESSLEDAHVPQSMIFSGDSFRKFLFMNKIEDDEEENFGSRSESETASPKSLSKYCSSASLVDQVADVDNLATKLLKAFHIIQLDNYIYIQELKEQKYDLETKFEIVSTNMKNAWKIVTDSDDSDGSRSISLDPRNSLHRQHLTKERKTPNEEMFKLNKGSVEKRYFRDVKTNNENAIQRENPRFFRSNS